MFKNRLDCQVNVSSPRQYLSAECSWATISEGFLNLCWFITVGQPVNTSVTSGGVTHAINIQEIRKTQKFVRNQSEPWFLCRCMDSTQSQKCHWQCRSDSVNRTNCTHKQPYAERWLFACSGPIPSTGRIPALEEGVEKPSSVMGFWGVGGLSGPSSYTYIE